MESLKFRKGLEQNLPKELEKDTIYITTDTKKIRMNNAIWEDTEEVKKHLIDIINEDEEVISSSLNDLNELISVNKESISSLKSDLLNKVDKIDGKQLSTEDFTTVLKNKLNSLTNYNDEEITNRINSLEENLNAIVSANPSQAINNFNEIIAFLKNIEDSEDLDSIIASIEQQISNVLKQVVENEKVVATSLNDLNNKFTEFAKLINLSYSELIDLKNNSKLLPNSKYRITDYVTTTSKENTKSNNHQFDIVIQALSENTLSEDATAILHDGDTYFADSNLGAWEIKYCLENDTNRFSWADTTNGKGVIYYMKDEFSNECPYDFKNIQFLRNEEWLNENSDWKSVVLGSFNATSLWLYTFSFYNNTLGFVDDSLKLYTNPSPHYSHGNTIKEYYRNEDGKLDLNNIIFITTSTSPYNNHIDYNSFNLSFGNNCYDNKIGTNSSDNIIGNNVYLNTINSGFKNNKVYNVNKNSKFTNNIILNDCQNNIFPRQFDSNICGNNFIGNDFITQTEYSNLGNVSNCNFGNNFTYNVGLQYKLSNIEILNNTLKFSNTNKGNWNDIQLNIGKTINTYLMDLETLLGSFKLRIGINEYGQYFAHDVDTDGIYRLGEFNTFDAAMEKASLPEIAGKNTITKILFTSGTNSGIIEQYTHNNKTTQIITWNSGFRMRNITFSDNSKTTVTNVSNWYWSNPTELYYDTTQHKIALTRFDDGRTWGLSGCFGAVEIPEATTNHSGLLTSNEKQIFSHIKHLGNFTSSSDAENEASKIENLNKKITTLFYTINNEKACVIEQQFSNNEIYQYLMLDGNKYVRKIIVENNEVKEINGWQNINNSDKVTGLYYWPSTRQLCLTNIYNQSWGTTTLPLASEENDGLMSKEDKNTIGEIINILKENEEIVATSLNDLNNKINNNTLNDEIIATSLNDLSEIVNNNTLNNENIANSLNDLSEIVNNNTVKKDEIVTIESNGIMSKEDKVNLDRVKEFVYDLGTITQNTSGTAWQNMLREAAKVSNNQNIGIITFKLDDNWDRNKNGVIEQQVGNTTTMQTLKWDNCESIRYITFADSNKTTPQNPNQNFTQARTMPTNLYYDGTNKTLSLRQKNGNNNYVNGLDGRADFGNITLPEATSTISSVVKLDSDYTKNTSNTALSLNGANNLYNEINETFSTINNEINETFNTINNKIVENEKVTSNSLHDLNNKISNSNNEILSLQEQVDENEEVTSNALSDLKKEIDILKEQIALLTSKLENNANTI